MNLDKLQSLLTTKLLGRAGERHNELWDTLDSTNSRAAAIAREAAPHGVIVFAREQTAGRGRLGRQWISQRDAGLYMSFLLRPEQKGQELALFTIAAGVAVAEAIEESTQVLVGLKWVNDLIVDGKKLGGILAEMPAGTAVAGLNGALIVGIGINLSVDSDTLPEELRYKVTSLREACASDVDASALAASIANMLEDRLRMLQQREHARLLDMWKKRSVTLGREIRATVNGREIHGTACDISPDGALVVESNGAGRRERIVLHAGEISIRNADGSYA